MMRACVVSLLAVLGGCVWNPRAAPEEDVRTLAPYLELGKTSRNDLLRMLGTPSFEAADERVVAYRMTQDGSGVLRAIWGHGTFGWNLVQYNMVLAFNTDLILEECTLIQLKAGSSR